MFSDTAKVSLKAGKGGNGAVFIGENGHGEDHAVVFALMLFQPLGVEQALVPRFDAAVAVRSLSIMM